MFTGITTKVNQPVKTAICLTVLIFSAISCASQKDVKNLNAHVNAIYQQIQEDGEKVQKSLKKLEDNAKENQVKATKIEEDQKSLRLSFAQLEADLAVIGSNIQELTGRTEETNYMVKKTIGKVTPEEGTMTSKIEEVSLGVENLQSRIDEIENHIGFKTSTKRIKSGSEMAEPVQESEEKGTRSFQDQGLKDSELYDKTLEYYREGKYLEAIEGFKNFLKIYPGSHLADNAYFWIGECYRALKKYKEAILAYQEVINDYPKGNKVPSAILHQALAFEKLDDKTTANLLYNKIVKEFPNTKESELAGKRLKQE
ncbi:MAG TPA: tol-pal system protein YbgF [Desulfatiglandales bacterium]|nr:tol-pal system protein YbgF [Desulfatiglandales bacterium]